MCERGGGCQRNKDIKKTRIERERKTKCYIMKKDR